MPPSFERSLAAVDSLGEPSALAGVARFLAGLDERRAKSLIESAVSSCSLSDLRDATRIAWSAVDGGLRPALARLVTQARITFAAAGDAELSIVPHGSFADFFTAAAEFADVLDAGRAAFPARQVHLFVTAALRTNSYRAHGTSPAPFLDAALAAARECGETERVGRLCDVADACTTLGDDERLTQAVLDAIQTRGDRLPTPRMAVSLAHFGDIERARIAVERLPAQQRPALALAVARAALHAHLRARTEKPNSAADAGLRVESAAHDAFNAALALPALERLRPMLDVADALADVGDVAGRHDAVKLAVRAAYETDLIRADGWQAGRELGRQGDDVLHVARKALALAITESDAQDDANQVVDRVSRVFQEQHAGLIRAVPRSKKMHAENWPALVPAIGIGVSVAVLLRDCKRFDDADEALSGSLNLFSRMHDDVQRGNVRHDLWRRLK